MKKTFVFLFVLQLTILAQSPTGKGSMTVGGTISFSSQSFDNSSENSKIFTFNPIIGYFFFDNFYSALSINYDHHSFGSYSSDNIGAGPTIRYYFNLEKIKPFIGLSFTYYQQTNSSNNDKNTATETKLSGGINFFLTNYFALESSINYSFVNYNYPSGLYLNEMDKSKLLQIAIGANYFIY